MPFFHHAGLRFHYLDQGSGTPFVLQHGLGANARLVRDLYRPQPGIRFLAIDCRGHGETQPLGAEDHLTFDVLADDLAALLAQLDLPGAVVGGISLGAGLALNFGLRYPERTLGLVLSRPAWLDQPLPDNLRLLPWVAGFIRRYGAAEGRARFLADAGYDLLRSRQPDLANALASQFDAERAESNVARLERLPNDAPSRSREAWKSIAVPTLVLLTRQDSVHPAGYAETLAAAIPGALLRELTPRTVDEDGYRLDTQAQIAEFLQTRFAA
jgi:pimeloyl-ACP methyl ester carboxylesterase